MKLGLGTVQFGSHYGISNKEGAPSSAETKKIIDIAYQGGIRLIDTASTYASSEKILGNAIATEHDFNIVTKTPAIGADQINVLESTFFDSLSLLQHSKIYGLLVHHCDDLFKENGNLIFQKMCEFKAAGLVEKLGVSLYTAAQIERVLNHFPVDIVQLPLNVLDQRLVTNGYLSLLKNKGVEIHARSVFLQGLLLMEPESLHPFFKPVMNHLKRYHAYLIKNGLSPLEASLRFVLNIKEVDCVIVGVNNVQELAEILTVEKKETFIKNMDLSNFSIGNEKFTNPSKWVL